jgi:hypothetical protein
MQPENVVTLGHNGPPEPTPYEAVSEEIEKLYGEATLWLDGEPVNSRAMADDLDKLKNLMRKARKAADEARKVEKKPFDDGAKEVQERYNPLLKRADTAIDAANKALAPWLAKLEQEKQEAARKAREEAEAKQRAAQEAIRAAAADDLAAREAAEALLVDAKKADKDAGRAEKDKAHASGGVGRSTHLRTVYEHEITNAVEFARYCWERHRTELLECLETIAKREASHLKADMPGVKVTEVKRAV